MEFDWLAKIVVPVQHKLYYFVMSLARFNLYANSYGFLAFRARRHWTWYIEVLGIVFFWSWYLRVLLVIGDWKVAIGYLLLSNMAASPLHVQVRRLPSSVSVDKLSSIPHSTQIVLSHFSRSTDDLGPVESFVHRQLRTTTDVICSDSVAFLTASADISVTVVATLNNDKISHALIC